MEKEHEFAMKIYGAIQSCFDEDSDNFIPKEDLLEGDNLTIFFHALANIAPGMCYNQITREDVDALEFNHIANKLCFQFLTKDK